MMDQKLKQRLVGAVVLISLAVIFIPVILEGPDDEWTPRVQEIPVPPQIEYQTEVELPVPDESPAPAPETTTPAEAPTQEAHTGDIPPPPAQQPAPVQTEPVAEQPPAEAEAPAGSWVIQVGSFSQQLNASGLRDRLKKTGYNSRLQEIASGNGKAWRVLVGPFETRAAAEKQRDRITSQHHMKGLVTQLKD